MEKLSPKAQSLVQRGRDAMRPTEADRERVLAALSTRLGVGVALGGASGLEDAAPLGNSGASLPATAGRSLWSTVSVALVGLGIAGSAAIVGMGLGREPAQLAKGLDTRPLVERTPAPPAASADSVEAAATPAEPEAAPPEAHAAPARRVQGRLAEEVAILSRAAADLRSGRAADALKALDEHQRKFPNGALTEERRAAKAEALCSLGRTTEANAVLSRLGSKSPHAARARQFCSARAKPRP